MVFRSRIRMAALDEGGTSKRFKISLVIGIVIALFMAYYIFSYSRHNKELMNKHSDLVIQLRRYQSALSKCDRSLRNSKTTAESFAMSNKQLHTSIASKEKEVADMDLRLDEAKIKLSQAYAFYGEIRNLLGVMDTNSPEKQVVPADAAGEVKQTVQSLIADRIELHKLDMSHRMLLQKHTDLNESHNALAEQAKVLQENNDKLVERANALQENNIKLTSEYTELKSVVLDLNAKLKKKSKAPKVKRVKMRGLKKVSSGRKPVVERRIQEEADTTVVADKGSLRKEVTEKALDNEIKSVEITSSKRVSVADVPKPVVDAPVVAPNKIPDVGEPNVAPEVKKAVEKQDRPIENVSVDLDEITTR